jgi:hypothetical protein
MTDRQINKTIAEYLGWKPLVKQWFCSKDNGESGWLFDDYKENCEEYLKNVKETDWRYGSTIHPSMSLPPKYCEDLNLMHEAELTLSSDQYNTFSDELYSIALRHKEITNKWTWLSSAAKQRAEAFLKTIGKWEG